MDYALYAATLLIFHKLQQFIWEELKMVERVKTRLFWKLISEMCIVWFINIYYF